MDATLDCLLQAIGRHRDGDLAGAGALCRDVLAQDVAQNRAPGPEQAVALHLLGVIALSCGATAEALDHLRRAAALRPDNADTRLALGNALIRASEPAAALAQYRRVVNAQPTHLAALVNMAHAALLLDQPAQAVMHLRRAVATHPRAAQAQCGLATALLCVAEPAPALEAARAATLLDPAMAEAWFATGTALSALGRATEAVGALERAVALDPRHAQARLNLGNARLDQDHIAAGEADIRAALALDPTLAEAHASLGYLLTGRAALDAAIAACHAAIRLRPDFPRAHWNLSFAYLLAGDYANGWAEYEWRRRDRRFADDFLFATGPEWLGEDLAGRHLLVHAQQGLGDTIQFARYLRRLAAQAGRVTLSCARPLHRLLSELPVKLVDRVTQADRAQPMPACDLWVDQMSLPRLLGTTPDNIPDAAGYLRQDRAPPAATTRLRVGIVGAGNPLHSNDGRRSVPVAALAPLAALPAIEWTSLQVGPSSGALACQFGVADRAPALPDFAATADALSGLDLLIAVDTSTAHLAGAMGVPVWIMLPAAADWRWMLRRPNDAPDAPVLTHSPWYRSARLFRQDHAGDWAPVIQAVAAALRARATTG